MRREPSQSHCKYPDVRKVNAFRLSLAEMPCLQLHRWRSAATHPLIFRELPQRQ